MKLKTLVSLSLIAIIASLSVAANAQTFSTIYAFYGGDGSNPLGLTIHGGVLYGTTGCLKGCGLVGAVFQMSRFGSSWAHTTIALVSGQPYAVAVFGPDDHLYGTTFSGGSQRDGSIFELTPQMSICKTANCFWAQKLLYQFSGSPDGQYPGSGALVWDQAGNIYGTTYNGGSANLGTVYEMTKSGNNWTEAPIYSFTGPDGEWPYGGVILDGNGNLFGTTTAGGLYGFGTVFELTYTIGVGWTETVLYNFEDSTDGESPYAGLALDSMGNLYGSAADGGSEGGGTVFELSPVGNTWAFTLLYSFSGPQGMGCPAPFAPGPAPLTLDNAGNLYGTTFCDGANGFGNIFKLTNTQNGWEYTSLHDFTGGTDGSWPLSNVTIDTDGTLYGTASHGGNNSDSGTVWMIKP